MTHGTPIEPTDARIERMLRQRAGSGAPKDLVAGIVTAVDGVAQRPVGLRVVIRQGAPGLPRLLLAAAVGLVVLSLVVGIVGGALTTRPPTLPTTDTVAQSPATSDVPSPTSPRIGGGLPAGLFEGHDQYNVRLVSDADGWVVTNSHVFRTTDGGTDWDDVSPGATRPITTSFIVDSTTVFAASTDGSTVTIAGTHDGGRTWSRSSIDSGAVGFAPTLSFRTPLYGTATFSADTAAGQIGLRIYETRDGGQTWTGPVTSSVPAGLKFQSGGGVLWASGGKADDKPFDDRLWLSIDGGQTWKARSFPVADVAPAGSLKWLSGPPWVGDDGRIELAVSVADATRDKEALFESLDDGRTWRLVKSWPQASRADFTVQTLGGEGWVIASPDGAEIWSSLSNGPWRLVHGTQPVFALSTSFGSRDHGLASHGCSPRIALHGGPDALCDGVETTLFLMTTADGGRTWTILGH